MPETESIIKLLDLKPLVPEGGFFKENYRSSEIIRKEYLPNRYTGNRNYGTAIYYMLTPGTFSHIHSLKSDETYHFYLGDPVEVFLLSPDGKGEIIMLGQNITDGQLLQATVRKGTWQGLRLIKGGRYALMGTTVNPGFEFDDFELGKPAELIGKFPQFLKEIEKFTSP